MINSYYDYEVVWDGGPLLPERPSKPDWTWMAPKPSRRVRKIDEADFLDGDDVSDVVEGNQSEQVDTVNVKDEDNG